MKKELEKDRKRAWEVNRKRERNGVTEIEK